MLSQYLDDKTAKSLNAKDLDRGLIPFTSTPFTSSVCYFISFAPHESIKLLQEARQDATGKLLSLIGKIEKNFPPKSDTDISGIEELYR